MPTNVYFVGSEKPLRLVEDYQQVSTQLIPIGRHEGQFTVAGSERQVTIYKANIAYIEDDAET